MSHSDDASALLAALVASTRHLLIATDLQGTVTVFNRAAELALGYAAEDIVGRQTPALWHDEAEVVARARALSTTLETPVEPGFEAFVVQARTTGEDTGVWTFIRKDGSRFPGRLTVTCTRRDEEHIGYLGVIRDITGERAAEAEIAERKAFLDLVLNNIPDYIFVKDGDFRIRQANPNFLSLYPPDQRDRIIGYTTVEEYDEKEAAQFLARDREALEQGSSETFETIQFPDGRVRTLHTKKLRFENLAREPFILGLARDVTEQQALTRELQRTNAELEEFSYRTSHDLRSPLVSSVRLLELARDALDEGDAKRARERLELSRRNLSSLETLVDDILSLARLAHQDEEDTSLVVLDVVQEALASIEHLEGFSAVRFELDIDPKLAVRLKPSRFRLIVSNLLSNAVKYHDPKEDAPRVRVAARQHERAFSFRVEDNGLGVPSSKQAELFGMFKRFHRQSFGSGLGLYMVAKSATVLEGAVAFSDPGKGAVFTLTVPTPR